MNHSTLSRIQARSAVIGIIGLGYVGLPLAITAATAGYAVVGFDVDSKKIAQLKAANSYIAAVSDKDLGAVISDGKFQASDDLTQLSGCDIIIICVPTPLTKHREPDLSFVKATTETIAQYLKDGAVVVLESTTWPWTTETVVKDIIESSGKRSGENFYLGFSPEREDPGSDNFRTATIPKVVSGDGPEALELVSAFYQNVVEKVIVVSSPRVAEATKITENIFRAVNIALVNELKIIYDAMDIDIWEVISAASTKPFGFMPFYPGPGLGGHCIPIDPFYLTWKAREYQVPTRFIELAGEINVGMPRYVLARLEKRLDETLKKSLSASKILLIGLSYKKNVSDVRESPTFAMMDLLGERGVSFSYFDPIVPIIPQTREHSQYAGMKSIDFTSDVLRSFDAAIIITDHDSIDYGPVLDCLPLVIDTRNAMEKRGLVGASITKA